MRVVWIPARRREGCRQDRGLALEHDAPVRRRRRV